MGAVVWPTPTVMTAMLHAFRRLTVKSDTGHEGQVGRLGILLMEAYRRWDQTQYLLAGSRKLNTLY